MVVGGVVGAYGSNAHLGTQRSDGVEADESVARSDVTRHRSGHHIDREHMDYYHDMDDVRNCSRVCKQVPFLWFIVLCLDDPNVQAIIPLLERRRMTYGLQRGKLTSRLTHLRHDTTSDRRSRSARTDVMARDDPAGCRECTTSTTRCSGSLSVRTRSSLRKDCRGAA